MIGDGRERFLREIAERIDPDRIEEVHLFPAIRQGGWETGIAVICATLVAHDPAPAGPAAEPPAAAVPPRRPPPPRLTVFRADYRMAIKGRERGKWELAIVEEADAPSLTVYAVVRGVHERAGVEDEPEHLDGARYRAALVAEPWAAPRS